MVMCLTFATGFSLSAQTIAIGGKVTNQSSKAISGAVVSLKSKNLTALTDAAGAFSIKGTGVNVDPIRSGAESVTMKNGSVMINLTKPAAVRVELFDMRGNLLEQALDNYTTAGNYRFDVMKHPLAANMMVVRVSIGRQSSTFRYLPLSGGMGAISSLEAAPALSLAKLQATVDTLQASAAGYKAKKVPISSYEGTVDIALDTDIVVVGTCTASKSANITASGSGPHKVVVETNADAGIKEGTIYRPADLGAGKNYPIFIWGEGGCSLDGKSNSDAMGEIASYGYFVIADGTPGGTGSRSMDMAQLAKPALAYISWAIAENRKSCSAYYQSLDTSKVAGNGFSCGGLFSMGIAADPRTTTWGLNSSGNFSDNPTFWKTVHTPVLVVVGTSAKEVGSAYENGLRDYTGISALGHPAMFYSNKSLGHGGDLFSKNGGDFAKIDLAWLNWWLKGDTGATGKGFLVGSGCAFCSNSGWEFKSANIP
jgi:hypothetical protein